MKTISLKELSAPKSTSLEFVKIGTTVQAACADFSVTRTDPIETGMWGRTSHGKAILNRDFRVIPDPAIMAELNELFGDFA